MIDLEQLRDRLKAAFPTCEVGLGTLEHQGSKQRVRSLFIDTPNRVKDHIYRMTIAVIDDKVNFFVHVHGKSKDLTTEGTQRYSKACADTDEVFAIVHQAMGEKPS